MISAESKPRLPPFDEQNLREEDREFYDSLLSTRSKLPFRVTDDDSSFIGMYRIFVHAPWLGKSVVNMGSRWNASNQLTFRMLEIAALVTAAHSRAAYVWYAHSSLAAKVFSPDEIDTIRERRWLLLNDPREQIAHDVVRAIVDDGDLSDELYQRAIEMIGHEALIELTWVVGTFRSCSLQLRINRLDGLPDGQPTPQWASEAPAPKF